MGNNVDLKFVMMDALNQAERLAFANPDQHAVIYRRQEPGSVIGSTSLFVRLADAAAPEGAELLTTVSRKHNGHRGQGRLSMEDAVRHVQSNLPKGVELSDRVVVEYYPEKKVFGEVTQEDRVFAYQFMSTEGRNVATWIPIVTANGVTMQTGVDGRGRVWKTGAPSIANEPFVQIDMDSLGQLQTSPDAVPDAPARRPRMG